MSFFQDFREFASRGNVVDIGVGVIIGAAFGKITTSFVNDIIMPPIGILIGGVSFKDLTFTLKKAGESAPAVTINYGTFINTILEFLIITFAVFLLIRGINILRRQEEEKPATPPEPPKEEVLLTEIRDLLKSRS